MKHFEHISQKAFSLQEAYLRAKDVLNEDIINPKSFESLYGKERVQSDLDYVARMEKKFVKDMTPEKEEAQRIATILEAIIHYQIEQSDWLGPEAVTIRPSRYDDIKNGVDTIVEFRQAKKNEVSHLALAIDVTLSAAL